MPAVTTGCRVGRFVAPVPMKISSVTATAAPASAPISFTSKRSEIQAEPIPNASASRSSPNISLGVRVWPGNV